MRTFQISDRIEIRCRSYSTRQGFAHRAELYLDGVKRQGSVINYLNRTWERYEFQSVMKQLVDKSKYLTAEEKSLCHEFIEQDHTDWTQNKTAAFAAQIGEVMGADKKESNDWKKRMLMAGLPGLSIPGDWDTLSEDEKERRLNKVIAFAKGEAQ